MTDILMKEKSNASITLGITASKKKYDIDDVGLAWSMLANKEVPCVFRLSCSLREEVNKQILQNALSKTLPRFPYFRVSVKKGFFWGKWITNLTIPQIEIDDDNTNQRLFFGRRKLLFRILVKQNRIAVEFHHILTDGHGSLVFLNTLLAEYFKLKGISVKDWANVLNTADDPNIHEFEDSFDFQFNKDIKEKPPKLGEKSFVLPNEVVLTGHQFISTITISVSQIKEISKEFNVTVTSLLAALYMDSLAKIQEDIINNKRKKLKPIRLRIPVNLRRIFDSTTMRNFSLFLIPGYNPRVEQLTLRELAMMIDGFLKDNINPDTFNKMIAKNRRNLDRLVMNITPFAIKRFFARKGYYFVMTPYYSGTFSNLGRITVPPQISNYIDSYNFVLGHGPVHKAKIGAVSFEDKLILSFNRLNKEPVLAEAFVESLASLGIVIEIE